jgi:uncharacterized protein (TIGR00730 family)
MNTLPPNSISKIHTLAEIKNSCRVVANSDGESFEICTIAKELEQGIELVSQFPRVATIYGSARLPSDHHACLAAETIAYRLVLEAGYAIMTGGAGGIMAAGNRGAHLAGGNSIGSTIKLNHEQVTNPDVTVPIPFEYFFTRKTVLRYGSECAIFFTGGFGTFDELFELLTLIQTNKIKKIPVILVGTAFWSPLASYINSVLLGEFGTITEDDTNLYTITDDIDEVLRIAASAPVKVTETINE